MMERLRAIPKSLLRTIAWKFLSLVIALRLYRLLAWFYAGRVVELRPDGSRVRPSAAGNGRLSMLALSPQFFRGDMLAFAERDEVRVLLLDEPWLTRLMFQFYPQNIPPQDRRLRLFINPSPEEETWDGKVKYREFLRKFIPIFNQNLEIDCVIGHHFLHRPNVDWGAVCEEIGVRYIALHSESMFLDSPHAQKIVTKRVGSMGKFEGSQIIVYCKAGVDVFSSTGYVQRDKIIALGAPRMDPFVRKVNNPKPKTGSRKKVLFFTFLFHSEPSLPLYPFFRDYHLTITELALENPDIDFIIKSKPNYVRSWTRISKLVWSEVGLDIVNIPNITVRDGENPHDLIFESDVVCAFNSTTMLETGVTAKPVIVPYFGELRDARYNDQILFRETLPRAFDVAATKEEFKALIIQRLNDPVVDDAAMSARRGLFEKYCSDLEGTATERYISLMKQIVADGASGDIEGRQDTQDTSYVKRAV
ncbi:MAG: hypothetical protein HOK30_13835 [Rhodospirillaceae bacterium]|jgi:hypothetical protein|nr:hypothetical protein [Rhodospirillaceae bacterium]MBT6428743.1 hypothetical protein [Rhodospirillaceae bacterium]